MSPLIRATTDRGLTPRSQDSPEAFLHRTGHVFPPMVGGSPKRSETERRTCDVPY